MMKAAVIEEPGQLTVRDVPKPEPGPYGALCELLYGATCTGTDQHLISYDPPFCYWVELPAILGHESIGRVVEIGANVRNLKPGDLVTRVGAPANDDVNVAWGGFAEFGVATDWCAMEQDGCPPEEWEAHNINQLLPESFDPRASTMIITWRETLSYLKRMGLGAGASIAILGSGGNGLSFLAHAAHMNAAPRVMVGSAGREQKARRAGADAYVDYRDEEAQQKALSLRPDGFDFVVDAVGKTSAADLGLSLLKPGGTFASYGLDDAGDFRLNPALAPGTFTCSQNGYDEAETHDEVVELVQDGALDASIWLDLDEPFDLKDIHEAYDAVGNRERVKALVRLRG